MFINFQIKFRDFNNKSPHLEMQEGLQKKEMQEGNWIAKVNTNPELNNSRSIYILAPCVNNK